MTKASNSAEPKTRLVRSLSTPTVYAEGISQMLLGFPMSRVMLHSLVHERPNERTGESEQVHQVACEIVMPTPALIEMARAIINNVTTNREQMSLDGAQWMAHVNEAMSNLVYTDAPEAFIQQIEER